MIVCKINVTKIDKAHLFDGKNGKYLDIALHENRDGEDQYGNLGFITKSVSQDARQRGEKGPIIGNFKEVGQKRQVTPQERDHAKAKSNGYQPQPPEEDEIPF